MTRQITVPLKQTVEMVKRVAEGDLINNDDITRKDEFGNLQTSTKNMSDDLRKLVGGISTSVTQIATAAEELSVVSEQTSAGVS
ncbi:methyl-accepting chemotaxis protein [Pseudomonas zeshuii]|uniref:Histidine kinase, HAMP region: chemotaxis sensory transducer n=1 Tax=Pseudomonas luteola TaxID=47886 RepID=A0A2X2BYU4_PSELU|nr:methyl-accepting chemotaxis protein [Pseudomonas zeshuii]SPZ00173.1 histidine kinase, HAMP region: chemotaxis sensory transducer [Pseudomonas luteola]